MHVGPIKHDHSLPKIFIPTDYLYWGLNFYVIAHRIRTDHFSWHDKEWFYSLFHAVDTILNISTIVALSFGWHYKMLKKKFKPLYVLFLQFYNFKSCFTSWHSNLGLCVISTCCISTKKQLVWNRNLPSRSTSKPCHWTEKHTNNIVTKHFSKW